MAWIVQREPFQEADMNRALLPLSMLVACGGDALTNADVNRTVDDAIEAHDQQASAHGGPFASESAIADHDADPGAHAGTFVTPADLAAHDGDPNAHVGTFASPAYVTSTVAVHDSDPAAHAGLFPSEDDLIDAIDAHDADLGAHPDLDISLDQLPLRVRSISLPVYATLVGGGATLNTGAFGNSGVRLPEVGSPTLATSVTVPEDFEDTELTLHVVWRTNEASCTVNLLPNFIDRGRPGSAISTGNAVDGLIGPLTPMTSPATVNQTTETLFTIAAGGGIAGIQPGDTLTFGLYRNNNAGDTCTGTVTLAGFAVSWDGR